MLYPLKFDPIYKQILWGGTSIARHFHRDIGIDHVAESWELCCREDGTSIVSSGALKGMSLEGLIVKYKDMLVGIRTYKNFGTSFPLLIKIIDAKENLSVQVHPNDAYAKRSGENSGKSELWYILDAKENAKIVYGVKTDQSKADFVKAIADQKIERTLNMADANLGDAFFVPAGKVHAILGGLLIAEIQQNSNTTYRIYDWGRVDKDGNGRALSTAKALDVIDFNSLNRREVCPRIADYKDYHTNSVLRSPYFNIDKISIHRSFMSATADSFIVLMCTKGSGIIIYDGGTCGIAFGETILLPACIGTYAIDGTMTLLAISMQ